MELEQKHLDEMVGKVTDAAQKKITELVQEATKGLITAEAYNKGIEEISLEAKSVKVADGKSLDEMLRDFGSKIADMEQKSAQNNAQKPQTTAMQVKAYLEANKTQFEAFRRGEVKSFGADKEGAAIELETKAAAAIRPSGHNLSRFRVIVIGQDR